jgi:hypothetical protein
VSIEERPRSCARPTHRRHYYSLPSTSLEDALGLTLEEIKELVSLAAGCNAGELVPTLKDILEVQLENTERRMKELATFRENLLYYKRRLYEDDPGHACKAHTSFCGCLEAVTAVEGHAASSEVSKEEKEAL